MPLVFFNTTQPMAMTYTARRGMFDLWAGRLEPMRRESVMDCAASRSAHGQLWSRVSWMGARCFTTRHFETVRIGPRGEASNNGRRQEDAAVRRLHPLSHMTFIHESGHHLYGLGDEYVYDPPGGSHDAQSTPANVFDSEDDCKSSIVDEGFAGATCVAVNSDWRIDSSCGEIMGDYGPASQWCDSSGKALLNTFNACLNGKCFE